MHITGKILAFFVIVLGGAAFVLTTQMLDFRHSWLKQVDANQKVLVTAKAETVKKRNELADLVAQHDRVMYGWDVYFNNITASGDPNTGTLNLTLGPSNIPDQGLPETKDKDGKPVMPVVHAFQPSADGKSFEYVGEFRAERLAAGNSTFKANWRIRPTDSAMWKLGPNWRIRTRIPREDKLKFDQLALLFTDIDERLASNTDELQRTRDEFAKKIKQTLANRESELSGFQAYVGERGKIDDEMIDGVLATMVKEEEARNAALARADELRHDLHKTVEQFDKFNSENHKAASSLPKGQPTPPATAAAKP